MNSTQNEFHLSKAEWFELYGSSLTLDSLILFLATPVSLAGILFNSISFYVLSDKKFESKIIFSYLKVYVFNSLLLSLTLSTYFNISYNYFEITNTFLGRAYSSIVYIPTVTVLAFFCGFLDILISVERLLDFYPHIRKPTSLKPCFISMFMVVVISLPYFFIYYPAHLDVNLSENESFRLYYIGLSEFGQSSIGKVVNNGLFFVKDVLVFIVEIVLSIILVVLLRKHNKKKAVMKKSSLRLNNLSPASPCDRSDSSSQFICKSTSLACKKNNSITVMVVVICFFSGIAHITTIMCNSSLAIAQNSLSYGFCFAANFSLSLKSLSNFFIFLFFNSLFFSEIKNILGIKSLS